MQGNFSDDALEDALFGFIEEGVIEDFSEYLDFGATCMRPDGSLYGISGGKCRKGNETDKAAPKPKRGRPKGGKNVAKAAPGEAAARMKAAYDKLVGIDLSKAPAPKAAPAPVPPSTKIPSGKDLTYLQEKVASLKAKDEALRDRAGNLMGPSGSIHTGDQTHFDAINKQVAYNWSKLNAAQKQLDEALEMRALGRPRINPSDPTNLPALEKKLAKAQEQQAVAGKRIEELRPYKDGQYKMPSKAADEASLNRAISMNRQAYEKIGEAQKDIRVARFDKRNTELQKVQSEALNKYKDLQAANKRYEAEVRKAGGPYGEKAAEALENRNRLAKEFGNIRDRYDKLVADKMGAPRAETIKKSDGLVTALGKDLSGQRRVVDQLEKEVAKLDKARHYAAMNPHMLNETKARNAWLAKENELSEAKKNLKNLEGAHRLAVSKELSLATRPTDRYEVRDAKKAAKDFALAIKKAEAAGMSEKDIKPLRDELSLRLRDIRDVKLQQTVNRGLSAKDGELTRQARKNNEVLQREKRLAEKKMNKLLAQVHAATDPAEKAKLRKQFDGVRQYRLDMVNELNRRYGELEAARKDRRVKQAEASAKAADLLAAREASAKGKREAKIDASINRLQVDAIAKGEKVQKIADAQAVLRRQVSEADKLQREAQERVQKYASMIRNARTPSEKELLKKAFEKRTDLGKQVQEGIQMRDRAEASIQRLEKEKIKALKAMRDADDKVNALKQQKKAVDQYGTAASQKTRDLRAAVGPESRRVDRAIAEGKAELLNTNKPDFDWNVGSGSGSKRLSSGAFGSAFQVPGPPKATVKIGQIGHNEAAAMDRAAKAGVGPEVYRAARDMNSTGRKEYGVETKLGKMAYEFVEGKPASGSDFWSPAGSPKLETRDKIWAARAKLHKSGVAHEDMHPGNVIVNKDGSVKFIDFGLAKVGNKQALAEALGVQYVPGSKGQGSWGRDGDQQVVRWKQFGTGNDGKVPPNLQRILDNRARVEKAMYDDGFTKGHIEQFMRGDNFRKADDHYAGGAWKHMSDGDAAKYIDMLYDGVS